MRFSATWWYLSLFAVFLALPALAHGETPERETLKFKFNNIFWYRLCSPKPFKGTRIHFQGTRDDRPEKALGTVTKKHGDDEIEIYSEPPLREIVGGYLVAIFRQCGMKVEPQGGPGIYEVMAAIKKFRAHEEKGLITGKGNATSDIEIVASLGNKKITAQVGYGIEFKKGRKAGIKRMREILNELFQETLKQVIQSPTLRKLSSPSKGDAS
jgi:hypothetical protein